MSDAEHVHSYKETARTVAGPFTVITYRCSCGDSYTDVESS